LLIILSNHYLLLFISSLILFVSPLILLVPALILLPLPQFCLQSLIEGILLQEQGV
jgi:hypothetical protein